MSEVTDRQFSVLRAIVKLQASVGSATTRTIGAELGIRSPNGVQKHLEALEASGAIVRSPGKAGGIRLTNGPDCRVINLHGGLVVIQDDGDIRKMELYRAERVHEHTDDGRMTDSTIRMLAQHMLDKS